MQVLWLGIDRLLNRARPHRQALSLAIDGVVIAICWNITYLFRLGFERWWHARPSYDGWVLLGSIAVYLSIFAAVGVPRGMWRFSGFGEFKRLSLACVAAGLTTAAVVLTAQLTAVPRAVLALHPFISVLGLSAVRMAYRMLYEHMRSRISGRESRVRRALVLGAGNAARLLLAGIQHEGWVVVGLLDDDSLKRGSRIGSVPILGPLNAVREQVAQCDATHVILALPGASTAHRRRAIDLAASTGLPVLTVPSARELLAGGQVSRVRDIEPEDLLGREPVHLDEAGISESLGGKTVLITGGGGSIGSELCRQVAAYGPARIVIYELSELALYNIEQEFAELHPRLPLTCLIGDVKDLDHLRRTFGRVRPHVVFHAAAYKHVPLMETDNTLAALRNNTLGTYHAALAAAEAGVERFVLVSTDKAVNPTSVMGATKRAAERVLSHLAAEGRATKFVAVRFGNVLGSSGSVIPKFKEQIARGGPLTVTHPEMTRYFMTIPEAARLVLQAAALADSGEVYVLEMGEPVKIVALARDLIRLAGHSESEIGIVFSGLRPGEKLYEELLADADRTVPSAHPSLRIARLDQQVDTEFFEKLRQAATLGAADNDKDGVVRWLREIVSEYQAP